MKLRGISHVRKEAQIRAPIVDASADAVSRSQAISRISEPSFVDSEHRESIDRIKPDSTFLGAKIEDTSQLYITTVLNHTPTIKPSRPSTLSKGLRLFRSLFLEDSYDDMSLLPDPFDATVQASPVQSAHVLLGPVDTTSLGGHHIRAPSAHNRTKPCSNRHEYSLSSGFSARLSGLWQQVCQLGGEVFRGLDLRRAKNQVQDLEFTHARDAEESNDRFQSDPHGSQRQIGVPSSIDEYATQTESLAGSTQETAPLPEQTLTVTEQSTDAAVGRNSEPMRGSIMAIVIGLVVGIMWF